MVEAPRGELESFFAYVTRVLERIGIPYMVVGGFAATVYGVPRLTLDVDLVADIQWEQVPPLLSAFPTPDYYLSEDSVRDSLRRIYPFNVIESATAAKVDIVPLPPDSFTHEAFQRRREVVFDAHGTRATFISAEDMVVAKLIAHRTTESDKHLRDAQGVVSVQWGALDMLSLRQTARLAGVEAALNQVLRIVRLDLETDQTLGEVE